MSNDTQKCVEVLTRCGPYSHLQAQELVPTLTPDEVQALLKLHAGLAQLEEPPQRKAGAELIPPTAEKRQALNLLAAEIGDRFRLLLDAIADRRDPEKQPTANKTESPSLANFAPLAVQSAVSPDTTEATASSP